jgi:uncharacterized membrane protein YfcA
MATGVEIAVVLAVALVASLLTLFSGFGLGTLLLPAFALVFPLEVAVAATAVVHLANNVWKGTLFRGNANWGIVVRFGVPALLLASLGAWLLLRIPVLVVSSHAAGDVTILGIILGVLIILFALFDLVPGLKNWSVDRRHLILGGALSGFFGGLSGHQGALRSVFLTKVGMDTTKFVATGTFIAIMVDVARLTVYGISGLPPTSWGLVAGACAVAFVGAYVGKRLIGKVAIRQVRTLVGVLLVLVGGLLIGGVV